MSIIINCCLVIAVNKCDLIAQARCVILLLHAEKDRLSKNLTAVIVTEYLKTSTAIYVVQVLSLTTDAVTYNLF